MRYDVLIIGGGPAGLSAGIFACRAGLKTLCLEKLAIGGQAALSYKIDNYPAVPNIDGFELTQKMQVQAQDCGLQIEYGTVLSLTKTKLGFSVKTKTKTYQAKKVIIACGCKVRKLNLLNEEKLTGHGVSYCASCDGALYKGKHVAVVGGGNTAVEDVEYLARLAKKIYLINRTDKFRAGDYAISNIRKYKNVKILTNSNVVELVGNDVLEAIRVNNNGKQTLIKVDGIFFAIGYVPDTEFIKFDIKKDKNGYILVDNKMATSTKNLYACGDIISKDFRQIITACAEGAIAGNSCTEIK